MVSSEMLERNLVAEEERLVGRHRLDHLDREPLGARVAQPLHEVAQTGETGPARDRQQPALDQILLVGRQNEARTLPQQLAQIVVIEGCHGRPPAKMRMSFDAI